ncbi:MAG: hypothetical protein HY319_10195 [Armatimonadetes bacterium]|nr:hypothetical protein [Armatimonadota bacterium]
MDGLEAGLTGVFLLLFLLGIAFGGVILRIACGLVGVDPAPELGRAMLVVLANGAAVLVASMIMGLLGLNHQVLLLLVSVGTSCAIYSAMIPTTPAKALMIWLAQILVLFLLGMVLGGVLIGSNFLLT